MALEQTVVTASVLGDVYVIVVDHSQQKLFRSNIYIFEASL